MDWLSQTPEIWSSLLYILAGHFEHAGVLGDIVTKADQSSVAQELGGDPIKVMAAPKHVLQRKLLDGLRYLVKEELKLNNAGPADEGLWLVSKTVADKLRAHLLSQGISGIPSKNSVIFDVLQEHGVLLTTHNDKAIWNTTVKSESGWGNHFTFLKVAPLLIWESDDKPEIFAGTITIDPDNDTTETISIDDSANMIEPNTAVSNEQAPRTDSLEAVFDILGMDNTELPMIPPEILAEEPKITETVSSSPPLQLPDLLASLFKEEAINKYSEAEPSGEHFIMWLKEAIINRKLIINDVKA